MEEECEQVVIEILRGKKLTAQGIIQNMAKKREQLERELSWTPWKKKREKLLRKIRRYEWNPDYVMEVIKAMEKKGIIECVKEAKKEVKMMGVGGQPIIAVKRDFPMSRFRLSRVPNQPA